HPQLATEREQLVFRRLIKDVVDDLHSINQACPQRLQGVPWLPAVDADADSAHQPLMLQLLHRPLPTLVVSPSVLPDVEKDEVHLRLPQIRQTLLHILADMFGRKCLVQDITAARGPAEILGRNLSGGVESPAGVGPHQMTKQSLTMARPIAPGRVKEGASKLHGQL